MADGNKLYNGTNDVKLCIATLNVRGLREKQKCESVSYWFNSQKIDILCLQETYCTKDFEDKFKYQWLQNAFSIEHCFTDSSHSKGVTIVFRKGLNVKIENVLRSENGRRLLINGIIENQRFSIVNIYAPNIISDRIAFFKRLSKYIKQHITEDNFLFVCGDFNSVMDTRDRTTHKVEKCSTHFKNLLRFNNIEDVYRTLNPNNDGFTWIDPSNPANKS